MALTFKPWAAEHVEEIRRLNQRFREAGVREGFLLPEALLEERLSPYLVKRQYLLLEGASVRGGFLMQEQALRAGGKNHYAGNIQMPVSEGIVDRRFAHVAASMMRLASAQWPLMFAVGMGSLDAPFARLVKALGWRTSLVPFFFRVIDGNRFVRQIGPLRSNLAARILGMSRCATPAARLLHALCSRPVNAATTEPVSQWDEWARPIWTAAAPECSLVAERDYLTLPLFLPPRSSIRVLRAVQAGRDAGWAAILLTSMKDDAHFGNLRVGTLLDAMALPGSEVSVAWSAFEHLRQLGAELVISNQQHVSWQQALRHCGFLEAASNYVLALSPKLAKLAEGREDRIHVTRADGDGRIHL